MGRIIPLKNTGTTTHKLSRLSYNEGLARPLAFEFSSQKAFNDRANRRWASWDNRKSFWIQREYLLQSIRDANFDIVMEQFDGLGCPNIADEMTTGSYRSSGRSTFICMRTSFFDKAEHQARIDTPAALRRR